MATENPVGTVRAAGGHLAVHDVDLTIERGELFVVMGLSGSGKSTLIRMLNGLVRPTTGRVRIDGQDLLTLRGAALQTMRNRTVSMVFQNFGLLPHKSVRDNAGYGLSVRGVNRRERRERADWALAEVGLADWGDRFPGELSGGMQQRVGLARALATDAEVLLMDEPYSALDPLIRTEMQDLLLRLQSELHRTIVFVTHDLNEAVKLGDRVMVMRDGRSAQLGTALDIINAPADGYIRDFTAGIDRTRALTAEMILREPLLSARVVEHPEDVLVRLENAEANGVFVLDDDGVLLGIARDDTLAHAVRHRATTLHPALVDDYETVARDRPLTELCRRVGQWPVPLAVVDDQYRLLGVVPRAALLAALATPVPDIDGRGGSSDDPCVAQEEAVRA
nr:betaine/proline/choline family ABC transporter ATP-binding protein [Pseudonocardia sp. C8]